MTPERKERISNVLSARQPDLTLVLENVQDPHNISAVFRTADAVGIQEIYVLNTAIAPHTKFGVKSSASAKKWLTIYQFDNLEACFDQLRRKYDHIYATHLSSEATSLYERDLTLSTALVFGNEHSGVSDECLGLCNGNFIIPQVGMVHSLNISVACAVTLYEAFRQREQKGLYTKGCRLNDATFTTLQQQWEANI